MTLTRDRVIAIIFMLLSVFILINTQTINVPANISEPGARLFPQLAGVGMLICSLGMFFSKQPENQKEFLSKDGWKRLGVVFGALIVYFLGLNFLGFFITTPFCLFGFIYILKSGKQVSPIVMIATSIIVTLILYYAFTVGFSIALPKGVIFY